MTGVDVWRCMLDIEEGSVRDLTATLSPDEVDSAGRRLDPVERTRALVFHGIRRAVLSRYVGADPRSLSFERAPRGKPRLAAPQSGGLRFSVSRSGSLGVVAVARGLEVGVDVERIEPRRALGPIAERLFSEQEAAELRLLPEADRVRRFFELWTRKEAHAKALGVGLAVSLDRLGVEATGWSFHAVPVPGAFACTLCVDARRVEVRVLDHDPAADSRRAALVSR